MKMRKKIIYREEYMNKLNSYKDKQIIKVITGIRRSGKSTILNEFKKELIDKGVLEKNIISINFEDNSNRELLDFQKLHDYIMEKADEKCMNYIFLDEIQNVNEFQKCIDSLLLREYLDIYITGSNSYMLSGELATYLTGRYIQIHVLPLSFKEYLSYYGEENELRKYNEYSMYGGFPYLINLDNYNEKLEYLDSIYSTVIVKDVINRKKVNDVMMLESICRFLFDSIGSSISTKKISDTLTSKGMSTSNHTVDNYILAFIDSFLIYKAERFDVKGKNLLVRDYKYYAVDQGLISYLLGKKADSDMGHILENIVYLELLRRGYKVYVGKVDDLEVDFVAENRSGLKYYQVALTVRDEKVLERELKSLQRTGDHYPKYLLTLDMDLEADYDGITKINVIDWLLK